MLFNTYIGQIVAIDRAKKISLFYDLRRIDRNKFLACIKVNKQAEI